MSKIKLIIFILILGSIYKILMTWDGNFLFNMDNARDMVDVREMVVLSKPRLIGPTSAVEGFFNGPAWYYLLAIPFLLSGGDPYGSIIMEIILWAVGGFFLLKLVSSWSKYLILPIALVWIASDYIGFTTQYAFNPNPIPLLTPLFIYLFYKYLKTAKFLYIASFFFLGGLFFNYEMNFGIFIPAIIFITTLIAKRSLLKTKTFWIGSLFFLICLLPQILFEVRHNFFMSNSIMNYLRNNAAEGLNLFLRFQSLFESFFNVFSATLMNHKGFTLVTLLLLIPMSISSFKRRQKDLLVLISGMYILIPFAFYLFLPVSVSSWHLGGEAAALIILIGFLIQTIWEAKFSGKIAAVVISTMLIIYSFSNIGNFFFRDRFRESLDPSSYKNEIAAIDYVYKKADGKNFKVYVYLPSVIDYPYQYLIWWHGLKDFGYLPLDYAYLPDKFEYISNKASFSATPEQIKQRENSNLVFLIKEPNRNYTRFGWEGEMIKYNWETIDKAMVGPIEIEIKKETTKL